MNILLTGGTGLIGKQLTEELVSSGHKLTILSRTKRENTKNIKYIEWNQKDLMDAVNQVDIVINLAGEPIAKKRWTDKQKDLIKKSRAETTKLIVQVINNANKKPKKIINASAVGFYGNRGNSKLAENSPSGSGFLPDVCKEWEYEANKAKINVVILRIGVVLSKNGGALEKIIPPFKAFVGGPLGTGNQWMSWISLSDLIGLIKFVAENDNVTGILNATSPNPVTNKDFSNIVGKVLGRPSFMRAPAFALKILLGEMSDLLLDSQRVIPERALELGYKFKYPDLESALSSITS